MCGISGFTHLDGLPEGSRIAEATQCIAHRGPDQSGTYDSHVVSLGAVRLKIIDLHGGDQPFRTEDGRAVIVFNGEVYNHAELREELASLGVKFRSRCDTEVVLRAYIQWGTDSFRRLRGMFAFAIWTEADRCLTLVRDRLGIKPLYYCFIGRDLYFGSELKTLFVHPQIDRQIDLTGLNYYLSLNYIPAPFTMIAGIRKIMPGEYLEWRNGESSAHRYWELQFRPRQVTVDEAKEELDALLRRSVREHLISDVPLGVWSSGGLDSSTIVHYASDQVTGLKTFSVSFAGRSFDESRWFRAVAQRYGTDHHEFDLNPSADLPDAIEQMSYYSDEPSADAGAVPVWFLSKMTRGHVTVALSGEGADELFGGYNTYLADQYAAGIRRIPEPLRRLASKAAGALPVSDDKIGFEYKIKRLLAGSLLSPEAAHYFWNGTFSQEERQMLLSPEFFTAATVPQEHDFLLSDQKTYLPDDILYKTDRMSMAHSLEVRPPFLDHRIVEFAARLPRDLKIRGSKLKFILRQLMQERLPESVLSRKKEGFDIPAHDWLRTVLKPLLLDVLTPGAIRSTGMFEPVAVERIIRNHLQRRANCGYHLWGLLTLFIWMRRWQVQAGAPPRSRTQELQSAFVTS